VKKMKWKKTNGTCKTDTFPVGVASLILELCPVLSPEWGATVLATEEREVRHQAFLAGKYSYLVLPLFADLVHTGFVSFLLLFLCVLRRVSRVPSPCLQALQSPVQTSSGSKLLQTWRDVV